MSTETKQETVDVEFNSEQSKPDPIQQLIAIARQIQLLSPCEPFQEYGKYVSVEVSGYSLDKARVYFDAFASFHVQGLPELKEQLKAFDPEAVKRKRIESLKTELSKLEQEAA
jgi:hypothetical protein